MSKELEKRLLNTWPKIAAGPATTAQRELIDEAAAELKAGRENIAGLIQEIDILGKQSADWLHRCNDEEKRALKAEAELKARRERIEAQQQANVILVERNNELRPDRDRWRKHAEQAEAARDKALADVEKLREALLEIETVPVSSSGRDYYWTGREIAKAALKETKP